MPTDLTEKQLAVLAKRGGLIRRLVEEVRRRRAAEPKPQGRKHELTLEEKVGTEER